MNDKIARLRAAGQSVWIDYIRRGMLLDGTLAALVDDGVSGVTSNPTIFQKAIDDSDDYQSAIDDLVGAGARPELVYRALVVEDIRLAADVLAGVHRDTHGDDGYVSIEVDPALAHDTAGTITAARRWFELIRRPNVMIKVPATEAGLPAIATLIGEGINVNVTLIFSVAMYARVAHAYIDGLRRLIAAGGDLRRVASVASFFVSRVDTAVDKLLRARIDAGRRDLEALLGQAAIANSRVAYSRFRRLFDDAGFAELKARGARVQRPLWASTSTKDPRYPDTYYVDNLVGPDTVNTLPPHTLDALRDHAATEVSIDRDLDHAEALPAHLAELGIAMNEVTARLTVEGVRLFADSFDTLLASLTARCAAAAQPA